MTSNLGSDAIVELADAPEEVMRAKVMEALHGFFRPEMLNRIDDTVIFRRLLHAHIVTITKLQLKDLAKRLAERNLDLEVSDDALALIATEGYTPAFGARPVKRALRQLVEDPLSYRIIAGDFAAARGVGVALEESPDPARGAAGRLRFTPLSDGEVVE